MTNCRSGLKSLNLQLPQKNNFMTKDFLILFSCAFCLAPCVFSQNVGIGTTNPLNKLHVAGGFRLDTLANGVDSGLLRHDKNGVVYSLKFTGNVNDVLRGDGTFGAGSSGGGGTSSNVWMLNGNAGTDPTTNFIGTTDGQPLVFRVKNQFSGIIDSLHYNTAFGFTAFGLNTTGDENTAIGTKTLSLNTTGFQNTALGSRALFSNSIGNGNTAIGAFAFLSGTGGSDNTAVGSAALYAGDGNRNVAIGASALSEYGTFFHNSAVGWRALYSNTSGNDNTANGYEALNTNATGDENVAVGSQTLFSNNSGYYNTAIGSSALYSNTSGTRSTASGWKALYANTTGSYNTANGFLALSSNTTGSYNVANGFQALYSNNESYNTAMGVNALQLTTTSQYNTAVGYNAGDSYNNGYNNVFLGANTDVNANDLFNVIAIGQDVTCTASSQVRIGNSATNSIGGQVGWTTLSDERVKTNIQDNVKGLEFIKLLRPVTYNIDANKVNDWLHRDRTKAQDKISEKSEEIMQKARSEKSKIVFSGFLAQDVEAAAKKAGYNFSGIDAPKNEKDLYGLRYSEFVVPLVKAVQEQQAIIEKQQLQIDELKKEIEAIKEKLK